MQLGHPSSAIKDPGNASLKEDLKNLLLVTRPEIVYTHNPADKHASHIGVVVAVIRAIRELPAEARPKTVWGCEVWRGLDWMPDEDKVLQNVSGHENLAAALNGIFDSQISGGKRYDLATLGRRRANATFFDSHSVDDADMLIYGMDLSPLAHDPGLDILDYTLGFIRKFEDDVREKLGPYL
ncbi:MAG TPA: PIG-L family deacetylase, partial [Bacteroidia bacterium]|nr:PIG-L family deacetylase [Bacteroidia bacterium]